MTNCANCHTPNRPTARFCIRCGQPLAPQSNTPQAWLVQTQHTLALAWALATSELRAFYDEWVARRPALAGNVIAPPQPTQVTIVVQGLFGPVPFRNRRSQQPGLLVQVQDARLARPTHVILIGVQQGTVPQRGDEVFVWGQWDASANAYRAWRIQTTQHNGQPANLELTTGRPLPLELLSVILILLVLLVCISSLFIR